jgi:hypothetical protein
VANQPNTSALLNPPAVPEPSVGFQRPPSLIQYAEGQVQPPSALYVGLNDQLQVFGTGSTVGFIACILDIRLLLTDGTIQIQEEIVPIGNNFTTTSVTFKLAEGFLLSAALRTLDSTVKRGQVFAVLSIVRNPAPGQTINLALTRGYVTSLSPVAWPAIPTDFPQFKPGNIRYLSVANPGAGLDWSTTVPVNGRWRLQSVRATLVTAVAVANREAILTFGVGGTLVYNAIAVPLQAASLTWVYSWGAGVNTLLTVNGSTTPNVTTSIPVDVWLPAGTSIGTATQNIQGADQWSLIALGIEECIDA